MKKISFKLFIGLFIFGNLSCTKEELCKALSICDLASKIVVPVASIALGQDLSVINTILNIADANSNCGTEQAPTSESDFYPYYRKDANSAWQQLTDPNNNVISVPVIPASAEKSQSRKYLFNASGQYQFRTSADYNTKVSERDENNNKFDLTAGKVAYSPSNNEYVSEIITVSENPNIPYDPSKPKIELLEVKWIK
jgi:subtilase family serine protease